MLIETLFENILKCLYNILKKKKKFYLNIVCKNIVCHMDLKTNKTAQWCLLKLSLNVFYFS